MARPESDNRDAVARTGSGEFVLTDADFTTIAKILHADSGILLSPSKSNLVYSRLAKRLRTLGLGSFKDYCAFIAGSEGASERMSMLAALTTNVTHFFREMHHFEHLKAHLLPPLIAQAKQGGRIRIWSAGCSNGHEPYSIALTILSLLPDAPSLDIKILASDIDPNVVAFGRAGIYDEATLEAVPKALRQRWFKPVPGRAGSDSYEVSDAMRDLVSFRELNLIGEWPMQGTFQALFCRNVTIYFDQPTREKIWHRFCRYLEPGGWFYMGHSERLSGPATKFLSYEGTTAYRRVEGVAEMTPVRVLVVDDSRTMRALLKMALAEDPTIEVVGEAANPLEARDKMKALDPDVVTLDIEMPNMNGLEFLEKIMRLRPTPVIMVSNLTQPGAAATLQALETGAFDCISKPGGFNRNTLEHLPGLVKEAAKAKSRMAAARSQPAAARAPSQPAMVRQPHWPEIVAIGSSTGGVEALMTVLADFPADCPPTLIVQHLPAAFTSSFSARLDKICKATVKEGQSGEEIQRGHVYIAPGGQHMTLTPKSGARLKLSEEDPVNGHRPSVDMLFASLAVGFSRRTTGVILTGMGRDGAQGLLELRERGARTMAQDEATSLVYGMPRVAYEIGGAQKRVPLTAVAREIFS